MKAIKKKHYATKLKEEKQQLLNDIYAILDGNFNVKTTYLIQRDLKISLENSVFLGESAMVKLKNKNK